MTLPRGLRLFLGLAVGAASAVPAAAARTLRVVTTTTDLAAIARQVAGDAAKVESLAPAVANPHFVDARPSLIVKLMKADLYVQSGLELEAGWAPLLIQGSRSRRLQPDSEGFLDASFAVEPMEVPENPSRAMGDVHPGGNPHYLTDPENAIKAAELIAGRLAKLDPERAEDYRRRARDFAGEVRKRLKDWRARLAPYRGAKFVSYHRYWPYFARRFGLIAAGEIEPKPGIPPTASHTAALITRMKAENIRLILTDPWFEERTPAFLAERAGARVVPAALLPGARPGTEDYFAWMEYNIVRIAEALAAIE